MKVLVGGVMVALGLVLAIWQPLGGPGSREPSRTPFAVQSEGRPPDRSSVTVSVSIGGAVLNPGLYEVPLGTRVSELVTMAGGLMPGANTTRVKLAGVLKEGDHIVVPVSPTRPVKTKGRQRRVLHNRGEQADTEERVPYPLVIQAGLNGADAGYLVHHWRLAPEDAQRIVQFRKRVAIRDASTLRRSGVSAGTIRRVGAMRERE